MDSVNPPIKWHGGKYYLARKILALAPPHIHYVEPFAGGLQVLLAKDAEGVSEVANDVDGGLTNFWEVLADPRLFAGFKRNIEATPFSEAVFRRACVITENSAAGDLPMVDRAVAFFVVCRQSLAGRMKGFTGVTKTRTRRGMNNEVSAWLTAIEGLPAVHERLKRVLILNRNALEVILQQDGPATWFYCDPPYMQETRTAPKVYRHEMSEGDHGLLLEVLACIKGKFALSGYANPMYTQAAAKHGWRCRQFRVPNAAAGGGAKRMMTECLWLNY